MNRICYMVSLITLNTVQSIATAQPWKVIIDSDPCIGDATAFVAAM